MKRRVVTTAVSRVALTILAALVVPAILAGGAWAGPNVLIVVTDDQRSAGTMDISDPALDPMRKTKQWFGAEGTGFPRGSVTTPLCCPSRSSIFTGRYGHNHGVKTNNDATLLGTTEDPQVPDGSPNPQRTTLQYYLQQKESAQYVTAIFGKYLNDWNVNCTDGAPPTPPPFFDKYALLANPSSYSPTCVNDEGTEKWVWQYSTNYVGDKAVEFLEQMHTSSPNQPWFLYVAPSSPHAPFTPEPKYANALVPAFTPNDAFFENDKRDKPFLYRSLIFDSDTVIDTRSNQLRMLRSADDMVDRIFTELSSEPWPGHPGLTQADNTIAFYMGDNGYLLGEHGLIAKPLPYLEDIEVPFYLRWPGWPGHSGGETDNRLVANVDIAPTVLDAAGDITTTPPMDGQSLLDTTKKRNRFLTEFWQPLAGPPPNNKYLYAASIRTSTFHYVEYYAQPDANGQQVIRAHEYYDLTADPLELTNLLDDGDPKNDPPTSALSTQLAADRTCPASQACPPGPNDPSVFPVDTGVTARPDLISSGDVSFNFTSTEPNSTFECRLDGQTYKPCAASTSYTNLPEKQHTLSVRAVSAAGDADTTPPRYTWVVDVAQPDARITSGPPGFSNGGDATFTFTSSNALTFECTLDAGSPAPCTSPKTYSGASDGTHTFTLRATDSLTGKVDQYPATYKWSVDANAPNTSITCVSGSSPCPASGSVSSSNTATFAFYSPDDPNSINAGRFDCKLDSGSWTPCGEAVLGSSPKAYSKTYTGLSRSSHTFSARAVDIAGNADATPDSRSWQIPSVQPIQPMPDTSWPTISSGTEIRSVIPDRCGGWYVGGTFANQVGGVDHFNLLHIKADKTVDANWNPAPGAGLRAMVLWQPDTRLSGMLYLGGTFSAVNGTSRQYLAAISTPSCDGSVAGGTLAPWNPNPNAAVYALAPGMDQTGTSLAAIYAGGGFGQFTDGVGVVRSRSKVAELTPSGSPLDGRPTGWNPNAQPDSANVLALAVTANDVYVGGGFTSVGGSSSRRYLAAIDRTTGTATGWAPDPDDSVTALKLRTAYDPYVESPGSLPTVYVGGRFSTIGNTPVSRAGAAEINLSDGGTTTAWNPSPGSATHALLPVSAFDLVLGGAFTTIQGTPRGHLAETDRTTGAPYDWDPALDGTVFSLAYSAPVLAVGGAFSMAGGLNWGQLAFYCATTSPAPCSVTSP